MLLANIYKTKLSLSGQQIFEAPETLLCAGVKGLRAGALQQDRPGGEAGKRAPLQPGDLGSHALACCPVWVQGETLHVKHRAGVQRPHTEC